MKHLGLPDLDILYLKRFEGTRHPSFYMANKDKSFQMFRGEYSNTEFYTKDTMIDTWDSTITLTTIADIKDSIIANAGQIKKYSKRP